MSTLVIPDHPDYFRVAWQSALAAAFCLGFPAGLLLWLILFQQINRITFIDQVIAFLQVNGFNKIIILDFCSLPWSYLLARISGYRPWWKIGFATALGIVFGWLSPLSNMDGWFGDEMPVHTLYAIALCGIVFSATSSVGLAYGFILRNVKAALVMAFGTGLVSMFAMLLTILLFDHFGIRVGGDVPLAMSKVTAMGLLMSAITGGAVMGVGFRWYMEK